MKKFLIGVIKFSICFLVIIHIRPYYLIYTGGYKEKVAGAEIYRSLLKSKKKRKTKKILLGDSGAYQLFPNKIDSDTLNSLTCNQAVSLAGHYILLNNYLQAGNQVDTVLMMFSPTTFRNNLDQVFTYHYFLKPFYIPEYKALLTPNVIKQVNKIPFRQISHYPIILTSNWAPDFVSKDTINYTFLSPVAVDYLIKIKELSVKYHFEMMLLSCPLNENQKAINDRIDKNEINKVELVEKFDNYFKNLIYLPDSFFMDKFHLKHPDQYVDGYKKAMFISH